MTGLPCTSGGRNGSGGASRSTAQYAQFLRHVFRRRAVLMQGILCLIERQHDEAAIDQRPDRMQRELEARDDAEIAAAAANRPEQIFVRVGACVEQFAVGGDHVGRNQIVDGHAVFAAEPAEAAAERQTCDAGGRVDAERRGEPERLRFVVEIARASRRVRHRRAALPDRSGPISSATGRSRGRRHTTRCRRCCGRRRAPRAADRCRARTLRRGARRRRRRNAGSSPDAGRSSHSRCCGPHRNLRRQAAEAGPGSRFLVRRRRYWTH